mmetsp:Transcript_32443/g.79685  ORF Transcript_32443/g.79685 Transcript_32443/m.79685 type:complete len:84 (-) Transcript_32443:153-404(-)
MAAQCCLDDAQEGSDQGQRHAINVFGTEGTQTQSSISSSKPRAQENDATDAHVREIKRTQQGTENNASHWCAWQGLPAAQKHA